VDPRTGAAVWTAVNRAIFARFAVTAPILVRYLNWAVATQSGNVQLGIVQLTGTGRTDYSRVVDTGVIPCPSAGDKHQEVTPALLVPGDYAAFIWCDNTTASIRHTSNATNLPATRLAAVANSLTGGVPVSGTFSYSSIMCPMLVVEADST
jgi:hypothetical protein